MNLSDGDGDGDALTLAESLDGILSLTTKDMS
jgi:hypothetical protein